MISVERVMEYTKIEPEPPLESAPGKLLLVLSVYLVITK